MMVNIIATCIYVGTGQYTPCNYVTIRVLFYRYLVMFFIEWRRLLQSSQNDSEQLQHPTPAHTTRVNKGIRNSYVCMYVCTYSYVCTYLCAINAIEINT